MPKKPNGRGRNWAKGQKAGIPATVGNSSAARRSYWTARFRETGSLWTWSEEKKLESDIRYDLYCERER